MKKLITLLITIILLIGITTPTFAKQFPNKAHGDHGIGNVNQNFNGGFVDPWDNPPGRLP